MSRDQWRRLTILVSIIAVIAVLYGLAHRQHPAEILRQASDEADAEYVEAQLGGKHALETMTLPDKVLAYRLARREDGLRSASHLIESYQTAGVAVVAPSKVAHEVANTLANPASYHRGSNPCVPDFGVQLAFYRGNESVDVLICFDCSTLRVFQATDAIGYAFFRPTAHNRLTKAVQELFPRDDAIQSIKEIPVP